MGAIDLAGKFVGSYPADLQGGAGIGITKTGLRARLALDFRNAPVLDVAPLAGVVLVQDPATGEMRGLDFQQLPTSNPGDGTVSNPKLAAAPPQTVKGNTTEANAQPQDVPLSALASTGNPLGDAIADRLAKTGSVLTANPDTSVSDKIPFGNTAAKTFLHSVRVGTQQSLLGTTLISREGAGSGTFGPTSSDYALMTSIRKTGWDTNTGAAAMEGEINAIYGIARQGKKSDATFLLGDVVKRRDQLNVLAADESGSPLGFEMGCGLQNAAGVIYHKVHAYAAFIEQPVGMSGGAGYGYLTTAHRGVTFAAYGANVTNNPPPGTGFSNLIFLDTTGAFNGSGIIYRVDGLGAVHQGLPTNKVVTSYRSQDDTWTLRDQADAVILAVGRTSKVLTAPNGVQIGSGSTTTFLRAVSGTVALPSLASLAVADAGTVGVSGAVIGDQVTITITDTAIGFSGFRLIGVVTAPGTVTIRAHNLNSVTAGGFNATFSLKVERFS